MDSPRQNLRLQKVVAAISIAVFFVKITAWQITHSVAILTDALESIVNVIAGLIGVYSLYISAKPKDLDHPYGHGKVEFISAAIEGTLISVAGVVILIEAVNNLITTHSVQRLDFGILLIAGSGLLNFFVGTYCVRAGRESNSLALIASGKHLRTDAYTTAGIVVGLILIFFTDILWIDSAVAILFSVIILVTGYRILRSSVAGIMDAADIDLLRRMITTLNANRTVNWIDLHNLRIIKYGPTIHLDCHLTVPWYFNVHEAHKEIDTLSALVRQQYGGSVELFVHSDGCMPFSCPICDKFECTVRQHPFANKIEWNMENISMNHKHTISS